MKSLSLLLAAVGLKSALGFTSVHQAFPNSEAASQAPDYPHHISFPASIFPDKRRTSAFVDYTENSIAGGGNATVDTKGDDEAAIAMLPCAGGMGLPSQYIGQGIQCTHTTHELTIPGDTYDFTAVATPAYTTMLSQLSLLGLNPGYQTLDSNSRGKIGSDDKTYTVPTIKYKVHCYTPQVLLPDPSTGVLDTKNDAYGIKGYAESDLTGDRYMGPSGGSEALRADDMLGLISPSISNVDIDTIRGHPTIDVVAQRDPLNTPLNVCGFLLSSTQVDLVSILAVTPDTSDPLSVQDALSSGDLSTSDILFTATESVSYPGMDIVVQDLVGTGAVQSDTLDRESTINLDDADTDVLVLNHRTLYLTCTASLDMWSDMDPEVFPAWSQGTSGNDQVLVLENLRNQKITLETPLVFYEKVTCSHVNFDAAKDPAQSYPINEHIDALRLGPVGITTDGQTHGAGWDAYMGTATPPNPYLTSVNDAPWDLVRKDVNRTDHFTVDFKLTGTSAPGCCAEATDCGGTSKRTLTTTVPATAWGITMAPVDLCSPTQPTLELAMIKGNTLNHGFERLYIARSNARHEEQDLSVELEASFAATIGDRFA